MTPMGAALRAPRTRTVELQTPPGFSFVRTALSHGWFDLPPFLWDAKSGTLGRVLRLDAGRMAAVSIRRDPRARGRLVVTLTSDGSLLRDDREEALRQARWMLRLEEDLASFHAIARSVARPDLTWVKRTGAGRLLRAPSVFEDLVRMICTTNCGWPLTRVMIGALVARLGAPGPSGTRAFPAPEAMADRPVAFYRDAVRAGYRAAGLRDLARRVVSGDLDPERWADPALPDETVREAILIHRRSGALRRGQRDEAPGPLLRSGPGRLVPQGLLRALLRRAEGARFQDRALLRAVRALAGARPLVRRHQRLVRPPRQGPPPPLTAENPPADPRNSNNQDSRAPSLGVFHSGP